MKHTPTPLAAILLGALLPAGWQDEEPLAEGEPEIDGLINIPREEYATDERAVN